MKKLIIFFILGALFLSIGANIYQNDKINQIVYENNYDRNIFMEHRNDTLNNYENNIISWKTLREIINNMDKQKTFFGGDK